jgi:hypothetical protein
VTGVDWGDAGPVPALFDAATVNVYDAPLVRPVAVQDVEVTVTGFWATPARYGVSW